MSDGLGALSGGGQQTIHVIATTVDGITVVQYGAKNRPVVQSGAVSLKSIHGGDTGVA